MISLIPVLNLTTFGESVFSDRYLYIPSLGSCILIPYAAAILWNKHPKMLRLSGIYAGGAALLIVLVSHAVVSRRTTFLWSDHLTFCNEAMRRSPNAALVACLLAREHYRLGNLAQAEHWFRRAIDN